MGAILKIINIISAGFKVFDIFKRIKNNVNKDTALDLIITVICCILFAAGCVLAVKYDILSTLIQ